MLGYLNVLRIPVLRCVHKHLVSYSQRGRLTYGLCRVEELIVQLKGCLIRALPVVLRSIGKTLENILCSQVTHQLCFQVQHCSFILCIFLFFQCLQTLSSLLLVLNSVERIRPFKDIFRADLLAPSADERQGGIILLRLQQDE